MRHLVKQKWECVLAVALLAAIIAGASAKKDGEWKDKMIRLHVVANSDSADDQAQKLVVRDAVLAAAEPIMEGVKDSREARERLQTNLNHLTQAANDVLVNSGYTAVVTLQREVFPLREYETFSLPAGEYETLRVTIGAGQGQNWWCVVYPSLCYAASAEEVTELAVAAGLTEEEAALLTGQQGGYVFRFQIVELWQKLLRWLRSL